MSSFTACVMIGSVTISVTSSTNMTSISGVVLISHIGAPSPPPPTLIAMVCPLSARAAHAAIGLGNEAHLDDSTAVDRRDDLADILVIRLGIGPNMDLRLRD